MVEKKTVDLRVQRREMAEEKLNLSTSRIGIPLQRQKTRTATVSLRPIDQCSLIHILMFSGLQMALNDCTKFQQTQLRAHPLWGPADSSLPGLEVCTSSRSGSNIGETGESLEQKLMPRLWITMHLLRLWLKAINAGFLFRVLTELLLTLIYRESKKLASEHLVHGPLWPLGQKEKQKTKLVSCVQAATLTPVCKTSEMDETYQVSITPDKKVDT